MSHVAQRLVPRTVTGLGTLLVRGALSYGRAVSMIPIPYSSADDAEILEWMQMRSLVRTGVREIEEFLGTRARG